MESPEETVDGDPRRLDEILDRDEFRALVHNRESGEAADRLVDFLQLTRGQLLSTPKADRVTSNDVIAGNHSRERLRPAPFIRVDRRLRGDRIFLQRTDPHAEASVVLDREAQEGAGANPVRRGPVFRERDPEARIAELLDLAGFDLHGSAYIRARINTYSVRSHRHSCVPRGERPRAVRNAKDAPKSLKRDRGIGQGGWMVRSMSSSSARDRRGAPRRSMRHSAAPRAS